MKFNNLLLASILTSIPFIPSCFRHSNTPGASNLIKSSSSDCEIGIDCHSPSEVNESDLTREAFLESENVGIEEISEIGESGITEDTNSGDTGGNDIFKNETSDSGLGSITTSTGKVIDVVECMNNLVNVLEKDNSTYLAEEKYAYQRELNIKEIEFIREVTASGDIGCVLIANGASPSSAFDIAPSCRVSNSTGLRYGDIPIIQDCDSWIADSSALIAKNKAEDPQLWDSSLKYYYIWNPLYSRNGNNWDLFSVE